MSIVSQTDADEDKEDVANSLDLLILNLPGELGSIHLCATKHAVTTW